MNAAFLLVVSAVAAAAQPRAVEGLELVKTLGEPPMYIPASEPRWHTEEISVSPDGAAVAVHQSLYVERVSFSRAVLFTPADRKRAEFWICGAEDRVELHPKSCKRGERHFVKSVRLTDGDRLGVLWGLLQTSDPRDRFSEFELATGGAIRTIVLDASVSETEILGVVGNELWLRSEASITGVRLSTGASIIEIGLPLPRRDPMTDDFGLGSHVATFVGFDRKQFVYFDSRGRLCRRPRRGVDWSCSAAFTRLLRIEADDTLPRILRDPVRHIVALSNDGRSMLVSDPASLVDVASRRALWEVYTPATIYAAAITSDRGVAALTASFREEVHVRGIRGAKLPTHRGAVTAIRYVARDRLLAADAAGGFVVWNPNTGRFRARRHKWDTFPPTDITASGDTIFTNHYGGWGSHDGAAAVIQWSFEGGAPRLLVTPQPGLPHWASPWACAGTQMGEPEACRRRTIELGGPRTEEEARRFWKDRACRRVTAEQARPVVDTLGHEYVDQAVSSPGAVHLLPGGRLLMWDGWPGPEMYEVGLSIVRPGRCIASERFREPGSVRAVCSTRQGRGSGPVLASMTGLEFLDARLKTRRVVKIPADAWSCDVDTSGNVLIVYAEKLAFIPTGTSKPSWTRLAPDADAVKLVRGNRAAYLDRGALWLQSVEGEATKCFDFEAVDDEPLSLDVSPGDDRVAVGTRDGRVLVFAVHDGLCGRS